MYKIYCVTSNKKNNGNNITDYKRQSRAFHMECKSELKLCFNAKNNAEIYLWQKLRRYDWINHCFFFEVIIKTSRS